MVTEPLTVLPPSMNEQWELQDSASGALILSFAGGSRLTTDLVSSIEAELERRYAGEPVRMVVVLSGLIDICPDVSAQLARAHKMTRLALLGQSHVDEVISGFMVSDLPDPGMAKYVTHMDQALAYLAGP